MSASQAAQPRGRSLVTVALVVAFIVVPIAEVWLLTTVGRAIGIWPTLGILVAEAILGAWLMRREGARAWEALQAAVAAGRMPTGHLADAALVLVGGILLMLPGFFTDILGVFCLLPLTRPLVRRFLGFVVAKQAAKSGIDVSLIRARTQPDTIIRGETVPDPVPSTPDGDVIIRGELEG
ncbi:MAG: FxsA family protein [Propionicimonas sp.]